MSKPSGQFTKGKNKKMRKTRIFMKKCNFIIIMIALLLIQHSYSFKTSSGDYSSNLTIISSGGSTTNSSDYASLTAVSQPVIGSMGCSEYYKNFVGFMYTLNFSNIDGAPETKANLTSSSDYDSDGNIELNWTDESVECFETYRIYRYSQQINSTNIQNADLIASGIAEGIGFFEDNQTSNGTIYWYGLVTVDQAGNYDAAFVSNSINATANDTIMPKQLTDLSVTGSGNTATLKWKHVETDTGENSDFFAVSYKIYRGTNINLSKTDANSTGSGFSYLKTVSSNSTTDTISSSGVYHYIVTAVDDASIENTTITSGENYGNASLTYTPPSEEAADSGAGGGGGGGVSAAALRKFSVSTTLTKETIKQGKSATQSFTITNNGVFPVELTLTIEGTKLAYLSDNKITLNRGESKTIYVYIFASETQKPEIYTGKIIISSAYSEKKIGLVIEVLAKKALFDININIPNRYKYVYKDEAVYFNISLYNLGDLKPVDVNLYYAIKDLDGQVYTFKEETLAVDEELSLVRSLKPPLNTSYGDYLIYGKVMYGTENATAADVFYAVEKKPPSCYDEIKNQDEEEIDCGGVCDTCLIEEENKIWLWSLLISSALFILSILIFISGQKYSQWRYNLLITRRYKELHRYIKSSLDRGFTKNYIIKRLLYVGWNKKIATKAVEDVMLYRLTNIINRNIKHHLRTNYYRYIKQGYRGDTIKSAINFVYAKLKLNNN